MIVKSRVLTDLLSTCQTTGVPSSCYTCVTEIYSFLTRESVSFFFSCEESDKGHTINAKKRLNRWIHTKKHRNISKVSLLYLFYRKKVKAMIFSIRRPQYVTDFTYKVSTIVCNATPTLLRESKFTWHTRNMSLGRLW